MPEQRDEKEIEKLVEQPGQAEKSARSLEEAVDSHQSLEGFEAMNNEHFSPELIKEAEDDTPEDRGKDSLA